MTATNILNTPESVHSAELTASDRCDYCGAKAWVSVELASGKLLFCAHHARKHMDALRPNAVSIHDERHLLLRDEGDSDF